MQDRQDSNEILKTPDAADITLPGRAYLQVGNNEIYELFQSAWSGATYDVAGDNYEVEDKTIYMINDYGQFEAINRDLSGLENEEPQESQTELEAVIHHIQDVTQQLAIDDLKRPWLPPLPEAVYQEDLIETDFTKLWSDQPSEVVLTVGLKDVPEEQYQGPLELELKSRAYCAYWKSWLWTHQFLTQYYFRYCKTLSTRSSTYVSIRLWYKWFNASIRCSSCG